MVVCEVARHLGREIGDVLKDGYFKTHRTWDILNELRSRDLFELSIAVTTPHLNDEGRSQHFEQLRTMQPRRFPPASMHAMPPELMKEFAEGFNKAKLHGRRKQNRN